MKRLYEKGFEPGVSRIASGLGKNVWFKQYRTIFLEEVSKMIRKSYFFLVIITVILIIAGCGGGGPAPGDSASNPEIEQLLDNFKSAVEAYRVVTDSTGIGMLDCLSGADFKLTISNAGINDPEKSYEKLEEELNEDKGNQLKWRKSKDDGGNGYILELRLGESSYSNKTETGAIVRRSFAVYESATWPNLINPPINTDNGVITWQVANNSGGWKAVKMTIEYQGFGGAKSTVAGTGSRSGGFGFGSKRF
jgi:hypothetical protein